MRDGVDDSVVIDLRYASSRRRAEIELLDEFPDGASELSSLSESDYASDVASCEANAKVSAPHLCIQGN